MAGITDALCNSFKLELWQGIHSASDTYRAALIKPEPSGDFGKDTKNYSELGSDEIKGDGYARGGTALTGFSSGLARVTPKLDEAWINFSDPVWPPPTTLSASGLLIYNASKNNRAVAVWRFKNAPVNSINGEFRVPLPAPGPTSFLRIR